MKDISLILLSAGDSTRFGLAQKKQWLRSGTKPFWLIALENLLSAYEFKEVIIVSNEPEKMRVFAPNFCYIKGGKTRQESLKNALSVASSEFALTSDAARICVSKELVARLVSAVENGADCAIPVLKCSDSVIYENNYINRESLELIGTPQISLTRLLKTALETEEIFTDDSAAMSKIGAKIAKVKGDEKAFKLTYKEELKKLDLKAPDSLCFNGHGFDVHRFKEGDFITLCGVKIPFDKGILAHSDGDAPLHALCDALFGAAGIGDIGEFFPDNDERFRGADSLKLLEQSAKIVRSFGFEIINADITILCEKPKITPHKEQMRQNVAQALNIAQNFVNIKATTMEKMGFIGSGEGLGAIANATIKYFEWKNI